jgi:ankyrin repeat protein
MVKLLAKYGANLDARDPDGSTLIDIAGRQQDGPMIELLRHLKSSKR